MSLVGHSRREGLAPLVGACPNLPQNLTSVRAVALGLKVPFATRCIATNAIGRQRSGGRYPPGSTRWHAVEFRDRVEVVDPGLLRANKYLSAWHQFISLAKRSKAHVIGLWLIASRCRIDRCPAVRAKSLHTNVSTIGGLSIFSRFAGQKHERAWMGDDDRSQWSAAHGLAVCAVANGRRFRIGFGLERHVAAVTASINFHDRSLEFRKRGWMIP
jgi:hypothetical protein